MNGNDQKMSEIVVGNQKITTGVHSTVPVDITGGDMIDENQSPTKVKILKA